MPSQDYTDMQIALQARRRLELPLLALVWLGVLVSTVVDNNWFYLAAGTFAVGANLWAVLRHREVYAHSLFVKIGIALAVIVMAVELGSLRVPPVQAAAHGLILIQICKLFDRKTNRDYVQWLVLSGMTVVPAAILCVSPWCGLLILLYVVGLIHVAMVLTVKRGLEASLARWPGESPLSNPQQALWNSMRTWPGRPMRRLGALLVIVFFAAGALMFLLAPRDSHAFTARTLLSSPVQEHVSGFRAQIVLGQARRIRESDQVVMRVQTPRHSLSLRYLRGAVYDSYSSAGSRWFSRGGGANVNPPLTLGPELLRQLVPVRISMDRSLLPWLFVPYPTLWVDRQGDIQRGDRELNFLWQEHRQEDRPLSYVAMAWAQPPSDAQCQVLDYLRRQHDQRHPAPPAELEVPPSVEAMARQWCSDLLEQRRFGGANANELDLAIAHRLAQRLGQWCSYTLDLTDIDTRLDPLEDFLLKTRRGNCEYFASALALMCNSLQVRARLASGYLMNEYNPVTGQYVVRQRDAHAWAEVYTQAGDWQVFDATPRAREPSLQNQSLPGRLEQYAEAVRAFWYEKVLGYNGQLRQRLMEQVYELGLVLWHALRLRVLWVGQSALRTLLSGQTELILARLSGLLGMGAIGVFGLILWRANARARRRRALARGQCWAALLLVPELVDRLAGSAGAGDDLTLRQRALARCQVLGLDPQAVGELVGIYYSARWGGAWPDDPVIRRARSLARRMARDWGLRPRRGV